MIALADVLSILQGAVDAGQALPTIFGWLKTNHPKLNIDALPDVDGDMDRARDQALGRAGKDQHG